MCDPLRQASRARQKSCAAAPAKSPRRRSAARLHNAEAPDTSFPSRRVMRRASVCADRLARNGIYTSRRALLNRREIRGFPMPTIDTERFRLRNFVEKLVELGECEVDNAPIDLIDWGGVLDGNPRAVLFKAAGPEKAELGGTVMASRRRIAAALDPD